MFIYNFCPQIEAAVSNVFLKKVPVISEWREKPWILAHSQ